MFGTWWGRHGLKVTWFGLGLLVGAVGQASLSGRPSPLRNGASTALSHGLAAKRKAQAALGVARENLDDLVAEADQKLAERQAAAAEKEV